MHAQADDWPQRRRGAEGEGPASALSERIIGAAIAAHRELGPGLLESVYESALEIELRLAGLHVARQVPLPVLYRGQQIGDFRLDLLVEREVVIEVKSVHRLEDVHEAQILGYLKLGGYPLGLLINFNCRLLRHGLRRFANTRLTEPAPLCASAPLRPIP